MNNKNFERLGICLLLATVLLAGCGKLDKPSAMEMVVMAFDPDDADRRREGIRLLSDQPWGLEEPYLKGFAVHLAKDEDSRVRSAAARALGLAEDPTYLPNVVEAMGDPVAAVRWDAAVALDRLIGDEAIETLRSHATGDDSPDVRASCARALRHYRKQTVVNTLSDCLLDNEFRVRYTARNALTEISGQDRGDDPEDWVNALDSQPVVEEKSRSWWDWLGVTRWGKAS